MLRELSIENLAVIENESARFCGGFNVFTGETGAGKSVLIGGVNAILGGRVSREIVRAGAQKAVVTALFDEISGEAEKKLLEMGFECEELVLTREIFADGKSTARINGKTASASMLREIGSLLVDIHGQHDNRILMSNDNQRDILDGYADISKILENYKEKFREFTSLSKELKRLNEENDVRELKTERLKTAISDIKLLGLEKESAELLEKRLHKAQNSAKISEAMISAYACLSSDEEPAALELLKIAADKLSKISSDEQASELCARISAAAGEIEDVAAEIYEKLDESAEEDESALLEKVSAIKRAERKYNLEAHELYDYLLQCENELSRLSSADDEIKELSAKKRALADEIKLLAGEISKKRKAAAKKLSEEIKNELVFLDMPNVSIFFEIKPDKITINGMDFVELLICANLGEEPKPLNKTASGGELSRIMLAVKSVLARLDGIPTLIFDEIDSGISGRAAQKVGEKLFSLSKKRQVMCITHLAQIASKADRHLALEKTADGERTFAHIKELDFEGRKREIARIIDGSETNKSSLAAAEEMIKGSK